MIDMVYQKKNNSNSNGFANQRHIIQFSGYAVHSSAPLPDVVLDESGTQWMVSTGAKCITRFNFLVIAVLMCNDSL